MRDAEFRCVCDLQHTAHRRINLGCEFSLNLGPVANGGFFLAACNRLDALPARGFSARRSHLQGSPFIHFSASHPTLMPLSERATGHADLPDGQIS
jgi:hypothetical protein